MHNISAKLLKNLIREGVRLIGGCCGTTPEHIKFIKESIQTLKPVNDKSDSDTNESTFQSISK